jgi:ketosteroid isomerase-like protein
MTKSSSFISYLLAIAMLSSCRPKAITHDYEQLEAEVRDMFPLTVELFGKKDVEGLVNRFTPDGTLKITGNPIVAGHEALHENYSGVTQLENFNISFDILKIEIAQAGDMAYALVDTEVSFITPGGPFSDSGKSLLVLKRVNGKWKIAAENISSETPPGMEPS